MLQTLLQHLIAADPVQTLVVTQLVMTKYELLKIYDFLSASNIYSL